MGEVDGFKGASLLSKSALVLLAISTLSVWIAFTCTGWVVEKLSADAESIKPSHVGLWRMCSNNKILPACLSTDGWANDWYAACQALVTFGFLGINVALFLLILYMFVPSCQKKGEIAKAAAVVCFITGVLYLIGVIVFAAKYKDDINVFGIDLELTYCFGLSWVALILEMVAGVLVLQDSKKGGTSPSEITL